MDSSSTRSRKKSPTGTARRRRLSGESNRRASLSLSEDEDSPAPIEHRDAAHLAVVHDRETRGGWEIGRDRDHAGGRRGETQRSMVVTCGKDQLIGVRRHQRDSSSWTHDGDPPGRIDRTFHLLGLVFVFARRFPVGRFIARIIVVLVTFHGCS